MYNYNIIVYLFVAIQNSKRRTVHVLKKISLDNIYNITFSISAYFSPQGIIIREQASNNIA